jgi:hypothetical protein
LEFDMNKFLLAAGMVVATPLAAQTMPMPAPAPGAQRPAMHGDRGDRVQARAEVVARVQRMFATLDVNHDNVLDQTEIAAAGKGWDGPRHAGASDASAGRMPLDRNALFDMIDTDHNGSISRDEFARAPGQGMQWRAGGTAGDGKGGGGMARMWTMADVNHDGRVTLQEATDLSLKHFDRLDANHDGQLTPEERAAGRAEMEQMRGQ